MTRRINPEDYEAAFLFNHFRHSCYRLDFEEIHCHFGDYALPQRKDNLQPHGINYRPLHRGGSIDMNGLRYASDRFYRSYPFTKKDNLIFQGERKRIRPQKPLTGFDGNRHLLEALEQHSNSPEKKSGRRVHSISDQVSHDSVDKKNPGTPTMSRNGAMSTTKDRKDDGNRPNNFEKAPGFICSYCRKEYHSKIELVAHLHEVHAERK